MNNSISIYIHIPFCKKKCRYCDFYSLSINFLTNGFIERYLNCVINELSFYSKFLKDYKIESIYFGGGTPNSIDNDLLYKFLYNFFYQLNKIKNNIFDKNFEITIELNPQFISKEQIKVIKSFPINRVSLGVQALDGKSLNFLGRNTTLQETNKAIEMVLKNFENVSFDFIIGLPTIEISKTLKKIEKYCANKSLKHLSFYILNIAEGTPLFNDLFFKNKDRKKLLIEKIENRSAQDYLTICKELPKIGFEHYEISNFARDKNYSKHNLRYWELKPYLGLGSGAHSYLNDLRFQNSCLKDYISVWSNDYDFLQKQVEYDNDEYKSFLISNMTKLKRKFEILEKIQSINELIFLSLRTSKGLDLSELKISYNIDLFELKKIEINKFVEKNYINIIDNKIKITEESFLFYNEIVRELIL